MTKREAITKYGKGTVNEAESMYETLPDKDFWIDLDNEDQISYLNSAQWKLDRAPLTV